MHVGLEGATEGTLSPFLPSCDRCPHSQWGCRRLPLPRRKGKACFLRCSRCAPAMEAGQASGQPSYQAPLSGTPDYFSLPGGIGLLPSPPSTGACRGGLGCHSGLSENCMERTDSMPRALLGSQWLLFSRVPWNLFAQTQLWAGSLASQGPLRPEPLPLCV